MRAVLSIICGIILSIAVGFTLIAVGSGKVGELFGQEIFIASATDMKAVFILQIIAIPALLWILLNSYLRGQEAKSLKERVVEWEEWRQANVGKTII